jgi:D-alanyl-D-alanine carboxypeptidase/D-alanyl-D-alanine-endopeptidase (penicillin-binding protein 4)
MLKIKPLIVSLSVMLLAMAAGCTVNSEKNTSAPEASPVKKETQELKSESPAAQAIKLVTSPPSNGDPAMQQKTQQYVKQLAAKGFAGKNQGIWIQSGNTLLANYQGTVPLPAASLTKVATSLAALSTYDADRQFITEIGATGPIQNGVLQGDLVIQGAEDPFFVWEEAIALGNTLNQRGIKRVTGNLIIVGKFYMNYEQSPLKSGNLLKQALNSRLWTAPVATQYQTLPPGTPRPEVKIDGSVQLSAITPSQVTPLVRHYSYPLTELLKKMNRYSNNKMAQMIADSVGGAKVVAEKAAKAAGVPQKEIQLINGSGLGEENKISPRAVIAMFLAIQQYLETKNMTIADVFAVVGQDQGILEQRQIPPLSVVKSGSLNRVSALAGALPTQQQGIVWFALLNSGGDLERFRAEQEVLLKSFVQQWGGVSSSPAELTPLSESKIKTSRDEIVN